MYSLETISHVNIEYSKLLDIIKIKSSAWNYPLEAQLRWLDENIASSDIHCILKVYNVNVAYLNLVDIQLHIDGLLYKGYGIGNVCSLEKGKGHGSILMEKVNLYIKQHTRVGMLCCRNNLVNFYARFGWTIVSHTHLLMPMNTNGIEVMVYNFPIGFNDLEYSGNLF